MVSSMTEPDPAPAHRTVDEASNYCRNPDRNFMVRPWCYATTFAEGTDPKQECGLGLCNVDWPEIIGNQNVF